MDPGLGITSAERLAREADLRPRRVEKILRNPIYNGWVRRHRGPEELCRAASWRANPPVSDDLWARVEEVRRGHARGGGPRKRERVDLLSGLLECVCGRRLRSDGTFADGQHRKLHPDPCEAWGRRARLPDATWEVPILAQFGAMRLDDSTIALVVEVLSSTQRPVPMDRARIEKQMRELALDHVAGRIADDAYLARLSQMRADLSGLEAAMSHGVPAERAIEWLSALGATWLHADVPEAKADVLHAIYERIVVVGRRIVGVRLTPAAYAHGLAVVLPEVVRAPPAGFEPATFRLEGGCSVH